jgi:hypothetical protein
MSIYWGDLHNHCNITYGYGSLDNALEAARGQLDFCAVIGHAMWPDIPKSRKEWEYEVNYHLEGFRKLREGWDRVQRTVSEANVDGKFVTFQGYEMHSLKYGDHHFLSPDDKMPLLEAESPGALMEMLAAYPVMAVPHHIGYPPGQRGANWDSFREANSPLVEVYSKHGCSMSDESAYPFLHTMGPRDSRSTVFHGLRQGKRFGFVASTDHHAGYPGSYGDGRLAVLATAKTRAAIWDALMNRRVYAVTGDKIVCGFQVNGADFGSIIQDAPLRRISLSVRGCDRLDKIVVYKNTHPWKVICGEELEMAVQDGGLDGGGMFGADRSGVGTYKVRVELGWGKPAEAFAWQGRLAIDGGSIVSAETCFRGRSVLAPTPEMGDDDNMNKLDQRMHSLSEAEAEWTCASFKNPTTLHPTTAAVIFELAGGTGTRLRLTINGRDIAVGLGELLEGSRSYPMGDLLSETVLVHKAVPECAYTFAGEWEDRERLSGNDFYHAEVRQVNGQYAWITPVYLDEAL